MMEPLRQSLLLEAIRLVEPRSRVLDVGPGDGEALRAFRDVGCATTGVGLAVESYLPAAEARELGIVQAEYVAWDAPWVYDAIWASHVLEHQRNVGAALDKMRRDLKEGGWLFVVVPPMKQAVVGGHVALFNTGTLLYNLILAGFDCREARATRRGYNCAVFVRKRTIRDMPELRMDVGDIELLAPYFPMEVAQGFDGARVETAVARGAETVNA
jgi:SAM-dependent methyltransferase